jgi:hypothetical protein
LPRILRARGVRAVAEELRFGRVANRPYLAKPDLSRTIRASRPILPLTEEIPPVFGYLLWRAGDRARR